MTCLPPSPFFNPGATDCPPDKAAAAPRQGTEAAADLSCIGEIFVGARKLEPVDMWFENTAYPREDELLYEVLQARDDPHERDLPCVPQGLIDELDPMPLFLRQA